METLGTALLTDDIPAARAHHDRLPCGDRGGTARGSPELFLDLEHGDERTTVGISWSHDELEQLLDRATGRRHPLRVRPRPAPARVRRRRGARPARARTRLHGRSRRSSRLRLGDRERCPDDRARFRRWPLRSRRCRHWRPTRPAGSPRTCAPPGCRSATSRRLPRIGRAVAATDTGLASNVHTPGSAESATRDEAAARREAGRAAGQARARDGHEVSGNGMCPRQPSSSASTRKTRPTP